MTFSNEKMRMDQQSKLVIKSIILSNLFNGKYGLKLGEFNNTTGTERIKPDLEYSQAPFKHNLGQRLEIVL